MEQLDQFDSATPTRASLCSLWHSNCNLACMYHAYDMPIMLPARSCTYAPCSCLSAYYWHACMLYMRYAQKCTRKASQDSDFQTQLPCPKQVLSRLVASSL